MNDVATSPVFVDGTRRRSRRVRRLAYVATSACAVYMVVVGASLAAGQRTPMLELPFADPSGTRCRR
ncbi:hypothetical protein [Pseudonocardia sp. 73-21]|uniref:hypothetical protein n=1 Tax=Pseudonocardia sp. 73-21 TaxID=1895809 RepID=UPI0026252B4C|nr:hypothetical protein [Pseudonocardia sp. 73-21]